MAKTRTQTRKTLIKKEEEEYKLIPVLQSRNTTGNNNRVAKQKTSKNKNRRLSAQEIKIEQDIDTKSLLQPPSIFSTRSKSRSISQEQINQLIDYIVNYNINVKEVSRKAKLSYITGRHYYSLYKNDPEKKVPTPRNRNSHLKRAYTQKDIENLIGYINNDKMPLKEASAKANVSYLSGKYYYSKYLDDPEHTIPVPRSRKYYTQEQKNSLISYIVNDKMNITTASRKANMAISLGIKYYHKYLKNQCPDTPVPSHIVTRKRCTQEQKQELINYIVNDKMSITAAAIKANMSSDSGRIYYHKYFKKQHPNTPIPSHINTPKHYTQEQIKEVISYIVDDKLSIKAASRKGNMDPETARRYYRQYLKDNGMELPPARNLQLTQEQIKNLISYIVDDKMTITAAAKKVNVSQSAGSKYYRQYLKENNLEPPPPKYTQDRKNQLIGYIVDDKMSVMAAAQKANFSYITALNHYYRYVKDHDLDVPTEQHSQDKINEVIGYIVDDKMNITVASKKARISYSAGCRYYWQYLDDKKRDTPA